MTMRHVCSWQHQSTSEKIMGIEETPHGVYFLCGKSKPLGKKMPVPRLLTLCCLDKQDTKESDYQIVKTRMEGPSEYPASQKSLSDMLGL